MNENKNNRATTHIAVPLSPDERKLIDEFITERGLKKGVLTRIALLEHIEKAEAVSPS